MTIESRAIAVTLEKTNKVLSDSTRGGDSAWAVLFSQSRKIGSTFRQWTKLTRSILTFTFMLVAFMGTACSNDEYGPYHVIGYNYTDRTVYLFSIDGFGAGSSEANDPGGGGGIACCLSIPKNAKTMHIKVTLGWTEEQYEKDLPHDTFETDIPVPKLPNKHRGYIEVHFLPNQKIQAQWVDFPTTPHIPNAKN
ncbi:hypothetical protein LMG28688_07156 [Paraburkholderia caffeinitolerans]|uniref:DUF3304 domain-containing protein n=1 Tax=Paraburkholderia caffeinitolerans TaxID=1723730 RepID=A0A6J5GZX9_9BURK|nr:DUF3304 domain-containing protein [Paraburkholderia caffeinitolerans]CAB3810107.1 hypothetical protein LMG28688_07156 [Paraburkholderia caffeinitolerans]